MDIDETSQSSQASTCSQDSQSSQSSRKNLKKDWKLLYKRFNDKEEFLKFISQFMPIILFEQHKKILIVQRVK